MRAGNLFAASETEHFRKAQPLAARMRARTLEEFVGQQHFIGQGKLLYRGYPIEELSGQCVFGEVAYLLLWGSLPNKAQLAELRDMLDGFLARRMRQSRRVLTPWPAISVRTRSELRVKTIKMMRAEAWTLTYGSTRYWPSHRCARSATA